MESAAPPRNAHRVADVQEEEGGTAGVKEVGGSGDIAVEEGVASDSGAARRPGREWYEAWRSAEDQWRVPGVTTDMGSNISAAVDGTLRWEWNKCACHMLHICVQKGLGLKTGVDGSKNDVAASLMPLSRLSAHMHRSHKAWSTFKAIQQLRGEVSAGRLCRGR